MLDTTQLSSFTDRLWDDEIIPALTRYIEVPAKSPMFDADWSKNGYVDRVVRDAAAWVEGKKVVGLKLEVIRIEGRTPVILFEVPATKAGSTDTVLMYGHLDKQPEFNGWRNDLGPWTPKYDRRQAVWPRRRRRRLRGLRLAGRDHGAGRARHPASARGRPDRELRRKRLV